VTHDGYVKSFSFEWKRWSSVQLDSVHGFRESEETFVEKTGFLPNELDGKLILDVGCGSGRFLDVTSRWGGRCIGVDFSFAVESAYANVGDRRNVDVVQADIFRLPFRPGVFDAVFSLGVLHHTRDTREAFLQLPRLLREGGEISVWLYYYPDKLYARASDIWRAIFRYMPNRVVYAWCCLIVTLFSELYRKPFMSRHPWMHLRRVLPVNTHPKFEWRVLDTFDWYSPRFQDKDNSVPRVVAWFREAGLRSIQVLDFPTSVRGCRDSAKSLPLFRHALPDIHRRRILVFGAGSGGREAFETLEKLGLADRVVGVSDNDPAKSGTVFRGHLVRPFEDYRREDYDAVIIASMPGRAMISSQLERAGLTANRDFATASYISDYIVPMTQSGQS
jgi:SAM-dependent methyltransferase